jgi:hypothetical protein
MPVNFIVGGAEIETEEQLVKLLSRGANDTTVKIVMLVKRDELNSHYCIPISMATFLTEVKVRQVIKNNHKFLLCEWCSLPQLYMAP